MNIDDQFKAISDKTRRKILDLLRQESLNVSDIALRCETSNANISQHLKVLRNSELVESKKVGLQMVYSLKKDEFQDMHREVRQMVSLKDKILGDISKVAVDVGCESVVGATDSQDEGTLFIMKDQTTIVSFHYSFRLSSFLINVDIPSSDIEFHIPYQDEEKIQSFYTFIQEEVNNFLVTHEKNQSSSQQELDKLEAYVLRGMTHRFPSFLGTTDIEEVERAKTFIHELLDSYETTCNIDRKSFVSAFIHELRSFGKAQSFLDNPEVTTVYINGTQPIRYKLNNDIIVSDSFYNKTKDVYDLAERIARKAETNLQHTRPFLHVQVTDEISAHIVTPLVSSSGTSIILTKTPPVAIDKQMWIDNDTTSLYTLRFLEAAIQAKCNIIVSGGTDSGRTTAVNILSSLIPPSDNIVSIENSSNLHIEHPHVLDLKTCNKTMQHEAFTTSDLIQYTQSIDDHRLVLHEIQDKESAYHFLNTVNAGRVGAISSVYGYSLESSIDQLKRFYMEYLDNNVSTSLANLHVHSSVTIWVQMTRLPDGSRKITDVAEVIGSQGDSIAIISLFNWKRGTSLAGRISGTHSCCDFALSDQLKDAFSRANLYIYNYLTDFEKENRASRTRASRISSFVEGMIERFSNGYVLQDVIPHLVPTILDAKLKKSFESFVNKMNTSNLSYALNELKTDVNMPEMDILVDSMLALFLSSQPLMTSLHKVKEIIDERVTIREALPGASQEEIFVGEDWDKLSFFELLHVVYNNDASTFSTTLKHVCEILPDNSLTPFYLNVADQIEQGMNNPLTVHEIQSEIINARKKVKKAWHTL